MLITEVLFLPPDELEPALSADIKRALSSLSVSELMHAIKKAAEEGNTRHRFYIIIDEAKNFASDADISSLYTAAKQFEIGATISRAVFDLRSIHMRPFAFSGLKNYDSGDKYEAPVWPPGKEDVEKDGKLPDIETVISEEFRQTEDDFRKEISSRGIFGQEGITILKDGVSVMRDFFSTRLEKDITKQEFYNQRAQPLVTKEGVVFESQPKPRETVTPPDLSKIPLWHGRKQDGMPLDFIKTHYGQWLSAFGAEQNTIFQDQIRARDPKLVQGAANQLREERKGRRLRDFIKSRSARMDRDLDGIDPFYLKKAENLSAGLRRRRHKA